MIGGGFRALMLPALWVCGAGLERGEMVLGGWGLVSSGGQCPPYTRDDERIVFVIWHLSFGHFP
jgi:hypothetical protein